jgi:hypothetical protein
MKLDMIDTWTVRIDVDAQWQGGRTYKKHVNLLVMAPTAERAIELARVHYPESSVWAVNHAHKDAIVILDPERVSSHDRVKP